MPISLELAYNTQEKEMADATAQKYEEVSSEFKVRIRQYTCFNDITMDSDMLDILKFERGIQLIAESSGTHIEVCDVDNLIHLVSTDDADTMKNEMITNYVTLFAQKTALRKLVAAATNINEVQAINWDSASS